MDWTSIIWAGLLGILVITMLPRVKQVVENSPKGNLQDWMGFIIPIAGVALFIALLIALV